jgi:hypothetical protein
VTALRLPDRLAAGATVLAGIAVVIGLATDVYRDGPDMVDQARAADLATLFVALPALVVGLALARRGSIRGRLVVAGSIGYLAYTYTIYAFQAVLSPATPLHIAILGLAAWTLVLGWPGLARDAVGVGDGMPRRTTAAFLALVVLLFGGLWLGQIAGSIATGELPPSVAELDLPTSAVYTLDLAFALPLLGLAAVLLLRGRPAGYPLALAGLVFSVQMALSILGIFAIEASQGEPVDPSVPVGFAAIAVIAAVLAGMGLRASRAGGRVALDGARA